MIRCLRFGLGKRGGLRNKDVLLAPKFSSSVRMLKFLSSRVLLFKKLVIVMPWFGTNRQGIFELDEKLNNRKIPGIFCDAKNKNNNFKNQKIPRGMTINVVVFSLFLLFPLSTNSATYFLPDVQWNESMTVSSGPMLRPSEVSIDSELCEEIGYIYYTSGQCPAYHNQENCVFSNMYLKCDADGWCRDNGYIITSCSSPKYLYSQCPNGLSLYEICACPSDYKYSCSGTGYSSGNGTVCDSKYTSCNCATNYTWNGSVCLCNSEFQYSCIGTGYNSGSGESCGSKYKSCDCSANYTWNGSACVCDSSFQYTCTGTGYSGGSGTACNGKYTSCNCASGYTWNSSGGICEESCSGYCYEDTWTKLNKVPNCPADYTSYKVCGGTCYECKNPQGTCERTYYDYRNCVNDGGICMAEYRRYLKVYFEGTLMNASISGCSGGYSGSGLTGYCGPTSVGKPDSSGSCDSVCANYFSSSKVDTYSCSVPIGYFD